MNSLLNPASGLAEAEGFVKAALDSITAHVAILNDTGTIVHVNKAWRQFADDNQFAAPDYGVGSSYLAVCDRAGSPDAHAAAVGIRQVMAGQMDEFALEYACHSPSERHWFTIRVTRFTWRDQQHLLVMHQNITELKRSQIELREQRSRFISVLSHELRTPLGAIQLANSMLRSYGDRLTDEEKRESYDTIDTQVEQLAEIIHDVTTISRTDFTGVEFEPEIVDLETYLRDIIEEFELAYRMQCCIEFVGTGRRVEAPVDRKLLRRAITNLLTNAIKYSPPETPIEITLMVEGDEAVVLVRDHGIGIPEEDLEHLFQPFQRASNVGQIQGTGLGLAITQQAVEQHGGTISVDSHVGEGTTFIVRLPLKRRD